MPIAAASDIFRSDVFRLVVGELIVSAGVVALVLHWFRSRTTDRSTFYFGLAALLYGLRLIVEMNILSSRFPVVPWDTIESSITLVIGIPFALFFGSTMGRAYPRFVRMVIAANVLLALFGALALITHGSMNLVWFLNGVFIVASLFGWGYIAFFPKVPIDREIRTLRAGLAVMGLFSLEQNLSVIGATMRLIPRQVYLEPLGMIFLLGTFVFVSASRSLRLETNLISLRNELEIARQIQADLLPTLDGAMGGVEIHVRYSPAGSVAGDFYDVLCDGRGVGVLIADVSGHGVPAALSASMLKVALRAQADQAANPAEVLSGLNKALCGTLRDQFITAAYVYFDTALHELRYAGAGHPPILLWRAATKTVESLEKNGFFLGPFPQAGYSALRSPFEPGDRCLLYTDGVVEAANRKDEEFGDARLSRFLATHSAVTANEVCSALLAEVTAWSGGQPDSQQDDITFVAVEFGTEALSQLNECYAGAVTGEPAALHIEEVA